ncbi:cAMP-dependent protein kinase catalytic subunit 2 isoform X4 [Drosophila suzukii]|uniref:cAMP-dependent protein kinase catalytic subunit 2 isoform X4 n=1 Tax=Drosophila suzukii TaxID=28584 RepID=A0AB40DCY2_DROSZ
MSQHNTQYTFNSKEDYNTTLDNMSHEFDERWNHQIQSPYTNLENYITRAVLGNGSFGTVMLVKEKGGKNYYAAKMMSKEDLVRLKQVAHVHNEKHVLHAARFPFLIYLVDSTKCFDYLYLILPLVNGGELFSYHRRWVSPILKGSQVQREACPVLCRPGGPCFGIYAQDEPNVPGSQAGEHPARREGLYKTHGLRFHKAR